MYRIQLQIQLFCTTNIHSHFYTDYDKRMFEQFFIDIKARCIFLIKISHLLFYLSM